MCGIFGFTKVTRRTRDLAPFLALAMEKRGRESWGYGFVTHNNTIHAKKYPQNICKDWFTIGKPPRNARAIIYHTRAASQGAISKDNAHPFEFETIGGGRLIGIHNGVITNHYELNEENNTDFKVDSKQIWYHLANGMDTSKIRGWGSTSFILQDKQDTNKIYMGWFKFNHQNLHIFKLPDDEGFVFASEPEPITDSVPLIYKGETPTRMAVETEKIYAIDLSDSNKDNSIYKIWKQPFSYRGQWRGRHVSDVTPKQNKGSYPLAQNYICSGEAYGYSSSKCYDEPDDDGLDEWFKQRSTSNKTVEKPPSTKENKYTCPMCFNKCVPQSKIEVICYKCMDNFVTTYIKEGVNYANA